MVPILISMMHLCHVVVADDGAMRRSFIEISKDI